MVRKWITAAAAAGALSSADVGNDVSARVSRSALLDSPHIAAPNTERARIVRIAAEVQRLVARFADAEARSIAAPRTLDELGLDEVARADVTLGLEARFGLDIANDEAASWITVGDVVGFVATRLRESRRPVA